MYDFPNILEEASAPLDPLSWMRLCTTGITKCRLCDCGRNNQTHCNGLLMKSSHILTDFSSRSQRALFLFMIYKLTV